MFDFWTDLPAWLRLIISLITLGVGVLVSLFVNWRIGLIFVGLGCALLLMSEKSRGEKSGYRF